MHTEIAPLYFLVLYTFGLLDSKCMVYLDHYELDYSIKYWFVDSKTTHTYSNIA